MNAVTEPGRVPAPIEAGTYDVADLAAVLKCSERHVRNMVDADAVPGVIRFGRLLRFHRGLVDEWLLAGGGKAVPRE